MILDSSDPTGLGLFSRCARNQACKSKKSRPKTAVSRKSTTNMNFHEQKKKDSSQNWMSKIQSREQRQRKYKRQSTPAVGQYNPTVKQKVKFVWDVLKIYQRKNKQMKKLQQIQNKIQKEKQTNKNNLNQMLEKTINDDNKQDQIIGVNKNTIKFEQLQKQQQINQKQKKQFKTSQVRRNKTTFSQNQHCLVKMSRMTGRSSETIRKTIQNENITSNRYTFDSQNQYQIDLNKSVCKIKANTTQNIYFNKMIGRKQQQKSIGTANIYDYNMNLVKPTKKGFINFGIIKGRQQMSKRQRQASHNSSSYYDFNQYVWNSTSSVFRNTKKSLIPFDKQPSRK